MTTSGAGRRSQPRHVHIGDSGDPRPKKFLHFFFFFCPTQVKEAEGRACVFDSARPTAAMILCSSRCTRRRRLGKTMISTATEAHTHVRTLDCRQCVCVACTAGIDGEVCSHRGFVNLSDRSAGPACSATWVTFYTKDVCEQIMWNLSHIQYRPSK